MMSTDTVDPFRFVRLIEGGSTLSCGVLRLRLLLYRELMCVPCLGVILIRLFPVVFQ